MAVTAAASRELHIFTGSMRFLDRLASALIFLAPIILTVAVWRIYFVQLWQTDADGIATDWNVFGGVLVVGTVFGALGTAWDGGWELRFITSTIFSTILAVFLGLGILSHGLRSIPVAEHEIAIGDGTHVYFPGEQSARGFFRQRTELCLLTHNAEGTLVFYDVLADGTKIRRTIVYTLGTALKPGKEIQAQARKGGCTALWREDEFRSADALIQGMRPSEILPGKVFSAKHPWQTPVSIIQVQQKISR